MHPHSNPDNHFFSRAVITRRLTIPLLGLPVGAGFTSPAENYIERVCDLNDLCVSSQESTYYAVVEGKSMVDANIHPGDIVIIDFSLAVEDGLLIVAWYEGSFTVKRIRFRKSLTILEPANPDYLPVYVQPSDDFKIYGVVTYIIHKARKQ